MRSSFPVLLAVSFNVVAAGLLRRAPFDSNSIRSFNLSSVSDPASDSSIGATSIFSVAAKSLPLVQAAPASSVGPSKQVGAVPAVGDGPGAASVKYSAATTLLTNPSSAITLPSSITPKSPLIAASTNFEIVGEASITASKKQVGSVPAIGSGPGAASVEDEPLTKKTSSSSTRNGSFDTRIPVGTTIAFNTPAAQSTSSLSSKLIQTSVSSPIVTPAPPSSTLPATLTIQPISADPALFSPGSRSAQSGFGAMQSPTSFRSSVRYSLSTVEFSTVLAPSSQSTIPRITDVPSTQGNLAAAIQFNQFFSTMKADSECSAEINTQAAACINQQVAICAGDGKYRLKHCPEGQICRALPLYNGSKGISIQCVQSSDVDVKLSPSQPSNGPASPAISTSDLGPATQNATVQLISSLTKPQGSITPSSQSLETSKPGAPAIIQTGSGSSAPTKTQVTYPIGFTSVIVSVSIRPSSY